MASSPPESEVLIKLWQIFETTLSNFKRWDVRLRLYENQAGTLGQGEGKTLGGRTLSPAHCSVLALCTNQHRCLCRLCSILYGTAQNDEFENDLGPGALIHHHGSTLCIRHRLAELAFTIMFTVSIIMHQIIIKIREAIL